PSPLRRVWSGVPAATIRELRAALLSRSLPAPAALREARRSEDSRTKIDSKVARRDPPTRSRAGAVHNRAARHQSALFPGWAAASLVEGLRGWTCPRPKVPRWRADFPLRSSNRFGSISDGRTLRRKQRETRWRARYRTARP